MAATLAVPAPALLGVLWTVGVLAMSELSCKALRVADYRYDSPHGIWQRVPLLASELGYLAGVLALGLACLQLGVRCARPRLALGFVQLLCLTSFLVGAFAHGYFLETGSTLDYTLVAFAAARPRETAPIVASAIGPGLSLLLVAVPIAMLLPSWGWPLLRVPGPVCAQRPGWLRTAACACAALLLFFCASQLRSGDVESGFAREPVLQLASSWFRAQRASAATPAPTGVTARKNGASALRKTPQGRAYNVVFIVLESARADATTPYAPQLATTPFLAELAANGTLIERAYTVVPHTSKSLVAILCGFEPRTSTELVETQPFGLPGRCLPELLRDAGYDTAFFQAPRKAFESYAQLVKNLGFTRFVAGDDMPQRGFEKVNYFGYEDAIMLGPSQDWLTHQAREPFIAAYLTNASHHPYVAPKTWPRRAFSRNQTKNDYLNALRYVDSVVAKLVDQYKQHGLYERTLFVVLGDHGEGFDEHGMSTHDDILYEEGVRIPLVFVAPTDVRRAARIPGPVNQLAIVPTVLDVLGFAAEGGGYEAASVYAQGSQEPIHMACFRNAHCLAALREQHKLIYSYSDRPPRLYDLRRDPGEQHNLAADDPARVEAWSRDLLAWEAAVDRLHAQTSQRALDKYVQRSAPADLQHPRQVHFGELVDLIGFSAESTRPDGAHFVTHLHVRKRLPPGYHFVTRLRSGFWQTRTLDEQPVRGLYPYWRWQPGDYIANLQRTDWPAAWKVLEICLELLNADDDTVEAHSDNGQRYGCVPLTTLDHKTQREIASQP